MMIKSSFPNGLTTCGFPVRMHENLRGIELENGNEIVTNQPHMFVMVQSSSDGNPKFRKPAAFTVTPTDTTVGVTVSDFVKQVSAIVEMMFQCPGVFDIRKSASIQNMFVTECFLETTGHYVVVVDNPFATPVSKFDPDEEKRKGEASREEQLKQQENYMRMFGERHGCATIEEARELFFQKLREQTKPDED
jgi:hypothetical protein